MRQHTESPQPNEVIHANKAPGEELASSGDLSITTQQPLRYRDLPGSSTTIVHQRPAHYNPTPPPPPEQRPWARPLADYEAQPAVEADRLRLPSDSEKEDLKRRSTVCSHEGTLEFDNEGRPLNPVGRTGLSGKGNMYFWGPNQAADALLLSTSATGATEVLLIQRGDGTWATPGGFVDKAENTKRAAIRELGEEAIENIEILSAEQREKAHCIFQGYTADGRNTDHAWIETSVYVLHIEPEVKAALVLKARDDARAVRWAPVTPELAETLFSDHAKFIALATKEA